ARAGGGSGVGFVPCFSTSARGRACADVINPNDTLVYNGDLSFSKKRSSGFSVFENPAVLCGSELWGVEKEKGNNEGDGVRGGNAVGGMAAVFMRAGTPALPVFETLKL
ncbi:MAG: hypothetical protein IKI07_02785, partial [Prevotella sp.]|nr:hypothetical protein [Prevotella sp.]